MTFAKRRSARLTAAVFLSVIAAGAAGTVSQARAQDDGPPALECLRYLQSYERSLHIPQGLLTAVSLVETGRKMDEQLVAWPWTINVNGQGKFFETKDAAVAETRKLLDDGQRSIDIGCMQINLRFHPNAFRTLEDAFDPASNVAYGAQYLNSLHELQGSWAKAVERYHSSDDGKREEYREKVIAFWNNDARGIVMNAVLAENTDTPYHRAIRDFAANRYVEALDKYRAIVNANPKDRIGLLGMAMSYERLGRLKETDDSYTRYLAVEPGNQSVLTHVIQAARSDADHGRARLEALAAAGVRNGELLATLSEIATAAGDTEAALRYASDASDAAPTVTMYHLNAGILADRLNRPAVAVKFYEQFLALFGQQPALVDTSIDGVRQRLQFLRAHL